jgi:anthranilate synthase/aminodeoxychorismate synthase-like glutamine amidotransferase
MITIIDHRDSFTRNLEHQLAGFEKVQVIDRQSVSTSEILASTILVFSPGPGRPCDYPESKEIYRTTRGKIPILGICLGFQLMLEEEGCRVIRQPQVLHGVESEILADKNSATYRNIELPIKVGRYHSLQIDPNSVENLPREFKITSHDPIGEVPL